MAVTAALSIAWIWKYARSVRDPNSIIRTVVFAILGPHRIRPHAERHVELSGNEVVGEPAAEIQSVEAETQALTRTRLSVHSRQYQLDGNRAS